MARIKLGPMVTEISGSVGGVTLQRNKFGISIRQKPLPLLSQTSAQYNVRQKIASLQHSWQVLTDAQRLQWNRFLDFSGQTIRRDHSVLLSGHSLYLKYQLWRLLYDQSLLTTLAYIPMPDHANFIRVRHDAGAWTAQFDATINPATLFYILKLSSPRSEPQAFSFRGLRFMQVAWINDDEPSINTPYAAAFGVFPPTDAWIHYSVQFFSTLAPVFTGVFTGSSQIHTT